MVKSGDNQRSSRVPEAEEDEPLVMSEQIPHGTDHVVDELQLIRPMGGPVWWNSMLWNNFPQLSMFSEERYRKGANGHFFAALEMLNTDQKLKEQNVSFQAARDDLCKTWPAPAAACRLAVECMQYEGIYERGWNFPLIQYLPNRDNHADHQVQARRFQDNNVIHLGLNAEEFSEKVMPVGNLDAVITIADHAGHATWGYYSVVMRVEGWPFRVKKIGTFEGLGPGGHQELMIGLHHFEEERLWTLLEGTPMMSPTGPNGLMEIQGNIREGCKYWAQLVDLDWLGPKRTEHLHFDPEVPEQKGFIWFTVEKSIVVPSTGKKGVQIKLLDEGIVPAWLDLLHLRVFAGGLALGYLNEGTAEVDQEEATELADEALRPGRCAGGRVKVLRTMDDRKVVVENQSSAIVFDDPKTLPLSDFVDFGWGIFDALYKGATVRLGPRAGK